MERERDSNQPAVPPRFRSPSFPFIPLAKALDRARALFGATGHREVSFEELASAFGYGPRSSGLLQTASALRQFGLLATFGTGKARRFRLTPEAVRLVEEPDFGSENCRSTLQRIALRPAAFSMLAREFSGKRVTDAAMIRYLTQGRRGAGESPFTEEGARDVVGKFKETLEFAGIDPGGVASYEGDRDKEDKDEEYEQIDAMKQPPNLPDAQAHPGHPRSTSRNLGVATSGERIFQEGILGPETFYRVIVCGRVGAREIERLIIKLQLDKQILGEDEGANPDERNEA